MKTTIKTIKDMQNAVETMLIGKRPMSLREIASGLREEELGASVGIDAAISAGTVAKAGTVLGEQHYRRLY